jgi:outer membrane protein assembly factor BamA
VWPQHAVIAARAAGAASWGDVAARRLFSASGNGSRALAFDFDFDAVGLIRGLDDQDVFGTRAAVVNLDYRFPLVRIDRGVGTLPGFARVIHGAVFVDAGHGWQRDFQLEDAVVSAGAEVSLDAVIGYSFPISVSAGGAWVSQGRGLSWFARIGRAF